MRRRANWNKTRGLKEECQAVLATPNSYQQDQNRWSYRKSEVFVFHDFYNFVTIYSTQLGL